MTVTTKKLSVKAKDRLIENIYRQNCAGMQISVMRIGALFAMAGKMIDAGMSDSDVGAAMVAFVQKESVA